MGHRITAIITKDKPNTDVAKSFDLPVFYESGYAIIGLDDYHAEYWEEKLNIEDTEENEILLDCQITHYFCEQLGLSHYAIIHTEYFAGIGEQSANVYKDGVRVLHGVWINDALANLGVIAKSNLDEFDTLNLSKYRNFDRNFEKYMYL